MTRGRAKAWKAGRHNNRDTCDILVIGTLRLRGPYIVRFTPAFNCPDLGDRIVVGDHGGFGKASRSTGKAQHSDRVPLLLIVESDPILLAVPKEMVP